MEIKFSFIAFSLNILVLLQNMQALALCNEWEQGRYSGYLDASVLGESSGIAVSQLYRDILYHTNDSGDGPFVYKSNLNGANLKRVEIANFNPIDVEDLSTGPCLHSEKCLFVGDIGDNREERATISVVVVKETDLNQSKVTPLKILTLEYPDRPIDAESLSVHPNGDLYILTKGRKRADLIADKGVQLSRHTPILFKASAEQVLNQSHIQLEKVGEVDIASILRGASERDQQITSIDISLDGDKMIVLTYGFALEFEINFDDRHFIGDYKIINTPKLPQQEAITYSNQAERILFTSESKRKNPPIYEKWCK